MKPGTPLLDLKQFGQLAAACRTPGDGDIMMITQQGKAIRFGEKTLVQILTYLEIDLGRHWKLCEEYLKLLTKSEIEAMCDEIGLMVYEEDYASWCLAESPKMAERFDQSTADMIRRDRNHPSVVMWSIGNEILEQADADGWQVAKRLADVCREEDPTRPVAAGFNQVENAIRNRLAEQVDIPGFLVLGGGVPVKVWKTITIPFQP